MSEPRKYRLIDCQPGDAFERETVVFVDAARVVTPDDDDWDLAWLKSIAAKLDRAGYGVTDAKRERVKRKRRQQGNNRVIHVGHLTAWEGLGKVRVTLTGDAKKVRVEILPS